MNRCPECLETLILISLIIIVGVYSPANNPTVNFFLVAWDAKKV